MSSHLENKKERQLLGYAKSLDPLELEVWMVVSYRGSS
ncbi:rCG48686, isoform CRA_a [Rattus norvegicus]|uniref:RCG48686, isoform CRA_a n=1 Tax=Rattus norvegicus TaxID=10116 RepID=A6IGJ6_RAT|nr:rCG48686, isoform CRA_a [Rattus norvegicus]